MDIRRFIIPWDIKKILFSKEKIKQNKMKNVVIRDYIS